MNNRPITKPLLYHFYLIYPQKNPARQVSSTINLRMENRDWQQIACPTISSNLTKYSIHGSRLGSNLGPNIE